MDCCGLSSTGLERRRAPKWRTMRHKLQIYGASVKAYYKSIFNQTRLCVY